MSFPVQLYLYDISHGMAKSMSMAFLGQQIDGIWHTGIVVYGYEYYYGGGIQAALPGQTMAGRPQQIINLGSTAVDQATFHDWLRGVSNRFTPSTYSLLTHNCNHFTSACSNFLLSSDIPSFIISQPREIMTSPMGAAMRPMIENMEAQARGSEMFPGSWQEGEALTLPPIRPSSGFSALPTAPVSSLPAAATTATTTGPLHAHDTLKLSSISNSTKPLLSRDTKALSFLTLLKQASKKLDEGFRLTEADVTVLTEATATLQQEEKTRLTPSGVALFEKMVSSWPPSALLGVLGLFRLFLLNSSVLQSFSAQPSPALKRLFTLIPSTDTESKVEISEAVQVMALCAVSNLFSYAPLASSLASNEEMHDMAFRALSSPKSSVRLMGATVLFNGAVTRPFQSDSDSAAETVSMLAVAIQEETDVDTCSRMLLALAYSVYQNGPRAQILQAVGLEVKGIEVRFHSQSSKPSGAKVLSLCQDIVKILDFERQQENIEQAD